MTVPNPAQVRAGVATTPSRASGTLANDRFNQTVRSAVLRVSVPTARSLASTAADLGPVTPDEVIFDAFTEAVSGSTTSGQRATLATLAVEALREAGFDL